MFSGAARSSQAGRTRTSAGDEVGPRRREPERDRGAHRDAAERQRRQRLGFDQRGQVVGEGRRWRRPRGGPASDAPWPRHSRVTACQPMPGGKTFGRLRGIAAEPVLEDHRPAGADCAPPKARGRRAGSAPAASGRARAPRKRATRGASAAARPWVTSAPSKPFRAQRGEVMRPVDHALPRPSRSRLRRRGPWRGRARSPAPSRSTASSTMSAASTGPARSNRLAGSSTMRMRPAGEAVDQRAGAFRR